MNMMKMRVMDKFLILCFVLSANLLLVKGAFGFGSGSDRVLLRDIQVITLYNGQMTSARRSSPIPQLKCVGGTAGCGTFVPQVVQCHNRGSDGYDVQWECKTDMDNAYRFGQVQVSCEGYEYPDDPYVLRGSCGLEYTLDLTKEGYQQKSHGSYGSNQYNHHDVNRHKGYKSNSFGDIIVLVIVGVIIYAIYRTCIANNAYSPTEDGYDGQYPRGQPGYPGGYRSGPQPPGFRDEYTTGGCSQGYSSGYGSGYSGMPGMNQRGGASGGGGFWTGAATGGLLGYLMGNRGNTHYQRQPNYGSSWGSSNNSWFSSGSGSGSSMGTSTGTRTASGFGGTRRR